MSLEYCEVCGDTLHAVYHPDTNTYTHTLHASFAVCIKHLVETIDRLKDDIHRLERDAHNHNYDNERYH